MSRRESSRVIKPTLCFTDGFVSEGKVKGATKVCRNQFDSPSVTTPGGDPGSGGRFEWHVRGREEPEQFPGVQSLFELELVELQRGVPEGYMSVWLRDGPDPLFPALDLSGDKEVPLEEFSTFIRLQVKEGKGRLRPGVDTDGIIKDMFNNQDNNKDGRIVEDELFEEL